MAALMGASWLILTSLLLLGTSSADDPPKAEPRGDTYLDAYADSYGRGDLIGANGEGGYFGEPSPVYGGPVGGGPSGNYGPPPSGIYGPPQPRPVYGPPHLPNGGPYPAPVRPPLHDHHHHHHDHHDLSPAPYAAPDHFFPPIPFDISLLFKIILKVVIFKLIVKFIAVICLLLFLPALEIYKKGMGMVGGGAGNSSGDADDDRVFSGMVEARALNELTHRVTSALDAFTGRSGEQCSEAWSCRLQRTFQEIDRRTSIPRLLVEYLPPLMPDSNTTSIYRDQQAANRHKKLR
ncbi:uncharacterized protein LOC124786607 [Schistocerca piceifrons]|uniref:uncharacterized protein LOC124786607 n=1 Tax=Schistocerca piceifrons TaxID=274613 RepID=UPI001F5ECBF0|nr:uncharacterized protein LOC124786607 [Schistocerca piceifrons]